MIFFLCTMPERGPFPQSWWWFSTSIYNPIFFFFSFACKRCCPVSERANTIATRDSWSSSLRILASRTKPDSECLSFSAGCDVSSPGGDVTVLRAFVLVVLLGPCKICDVSVCQDGPAQVLEGHVAKYLACGATSMTLWHHPGGRGFIMLSCGHPGGIWGVIFQISRWEVPASCLPVIMYVMSFIKSECANMQHERLCRIRYFQIALLMAMANKDCNRHVDNRPH